MNALIFDFDGLILDTELPDFVSWQEVYASFGIELPLELWLTIVGGLSEAQFEPHEYLESKLNIKVDREQIWVQRRKSYLNHLEDQPILPGVEAILRDASEAGLKLGIASSSPCNWVLGHLTRLGLKSWFDVVITADDVAKTKPDPSLFLLTASKLRVKPSEVIVFEDSLNGVTGAKRAGMFVVAVPNQITKYSDFSAADLCVDSLADLSLDELLKYMESNS